MTTNYSKEQRAMTVSELRREADKIPKYKYGDQTMIRGDAVLLLEAADVIEQLEAALKEREQWNKPDCCVEKEAALERVRDMRAYPAENFGRYTMVIRQEDLLDKIENTAALEE